MRGNLRVDHKGGLRLFCELWWWEWECVQFIVSCKQHQSLYVHTSQDLGRCMARVYTCNDVSVQCSLLQTCKGYVYVWITNCKDTIKVILTHNRIAIGIYCRCWCLSCRMWPNVCENILQDGLVEQIIISNMTLE